MHRGIDVDIHLTPGLSEDNFIALALGNLAAHRLQKERGEVLQWQVLRIEETRSHHYRLVLRHPSRVLDLGLTRDLKEILDSLSHESVEELRRRYHDAQAQGLKPVALRTLHEVPDFWRDDFWNWMG
jgi:hypothetical protein